MFAMSMTKHFGKVSVLNSLRANEKRKNGSSDVDMIGDMK